MHEVNTLKGERVRGGVVVEMVEKSTMTVHVFGLCAICLSPIFWGSTIDTCTSTKNSITYRQNKSSCFQFQPTHCVYNSGTTARRCHDI